VRLGAVLAGAAAAAGAAAYLRRRATDGERVDLYYDDGSVVSPAPEAPETERILALAREALRAVRA
jgi:hypothetical protein